MDVNGTKMDIIVFSVAGEDLACAFDIDTEFCFFFAGGGVGMCLGVNVGVYTQSGFCGFVGLFGEFDKVLELRFGFDIEVAYRSV